MIRMMFFVRCVCQKLYLSVKKNNKRPYLIALPVSLLWPKTLLMKTKHAKLFWTGAVEALTIISCFVF